MVSQWLQFIPQTKLQLSLVGLFFCCMTYHHISVLYYYFLIFVLYFNADTFVLLLKVLNAFTCNSISSLHCWFYLKIRVLLPYLFIDHISSLYSNDYRFCPSALMTLALNIEPENPFSWQDNQAEQPSQQPPKLFSYLWRIFEMGWNN